MRSGWAGGGGGVGCVIDSEIFLGGLVLGDSGRGGSAEGSAPPRRELRSIDRPGGVAPTG